MAIERRDIDRRAGVAERPPHRVVGGRWLSWRRRARAAVRFRCSPRALDALEPGSHLGSTRRCCSPAPGGGLLNIDNFRRREWAPAITGSGVATPARIYDMRSTFASNAIAAGDRRVRVGAGDGHLDAR